MPLFSTILNFNRDVLTKLRNKRKSTRYTVGPGFPLRAVVRLVAREGHPHPVEAREVASEWSGTAANVSSNGLSLHLLPAAAGTRGDRTVVRLVLEDHELVIPCTIAYFRSFATHASCGLKLQFGDAKTEISYAQLVETISTAASLTRFPVVLSRPNASGLVAKHYRSDNKAVLTGWRDPRSKKLESFEFSIGPHRLTGNDSSEAPAVVTSPSLTDKKSAETPAPDAESAEVRRLLRWAVPNLSKSVPVDLREMMGRSAQHDPASWTKPPKPSVVKALIRGKKKR